jgi:hypothetical protein
MTDVETEKVGDRDVDGERYRKTQDRERWRERVVKTGCV